MSHYTLQLYKGRGKQRTLVAERTWNLNKFFLDEITDEAESLIEEAIETNEPDNAAREERGIPR